MEAAEQQAETDAGAAAMQVDDMSSSSSSSMDSPSADGSLDTPAQQPPGKRHHPTHGSQGRAKLMPNPRGGACENEVTAHAAASPLHPRGQRVEAAGVSPAPTTHSTAGNNSDDDFA